MDGELPFKARDEQPADDRQLKDDQADTDDRETDAAREAGNEQDEVGGPQREREQQIDNPQIGPAVTQNPLYRLGHVRRISGPCRDFMSEQPRRPRRYTS